MNQEIKQDAIKVTITGGVGVGKSALAASIIALCKTSGIPYEHRNKDQEENLGTRPWDAETNPNAKIIIEEIHQNQLAEQEQTTGLTFGEALVALRKGRRIQRSGWNGKGLFIYLVPADAYPAKTDAAKQFFGASALVPYNEYMALKDINNTVSTWAPSGNDALASDWVILEELPETY